MRLTTLSIADMNEAQRRAHDEAAAGKRGRAPAPLRAWLHSPELAARAQRLGEFLRYDTSLPPRLSELAILVTARHWTSHYEWAVHKEEALKAGLDPSIIEDIAVGRHPRIEAADAHAVYAYSRALHEEHIVPGPVHAAAVAALGEQGVVELVGLLGYYTFVSMTLNAFEIGLPADGHSDLDKRKAD